MSSANIRQHGTLQIFIFQVDGPPFMVDAAVGKVIAQGIWIVEAIRGELIEWRVRIGRSLLLCRQRQCSLPHTDRRASRREGCDQQKNPAPSRRRYQML